MPLEAQVVHVPAGVGIDESTRPELVQPGQANRSAVNVRLEQGGALVTRHGYAAQARTRVDGTTRTAGRRMFGHGKRACVIDGSVLDAWSPSLSTNATVGRVPEVLVRRIPVVGLSAVTDMDGVGVAMAGGLYFVLTVEESYTAGFYSAQVQAVDPATGTVVKSYGWPQSALLSSLEEVKIAGVGDRVVLVYNTSATLIVARSLDASSSAGLEAGFGAQTAVCSTWNGDDFDVVGTATSLALAWTANAGTDILTVCLYDPATLASKVSAVQPFSSGSNVTHCAIDGSDDDFLWVAWAVSDDAQARVGGLSPSTLAVTSTATSVLRGLDLGLSRLSVRRTSATGGHVMAAGGCTSIGGSGDWRVAISRGFEDSSGAVAPVDQWLNNWGWTPCAQPFALDGRVYALQGASADDASPKNLVLFDVTESDPVQATTATAARGPVRPVAVPALGNASFAHAAALACPHTLQVSSTKAIAAMVVQYNSVDAAVELVEFTTRDPRMWQPAEHNGVTCLSGGMLMGYDGQGVFEVNFVAPPSLRAAVNGVVGSGAIGTGATDGYLYTVIVEWVDGEGNVHWSSPAPVQTVTLSTQKCDVSVLGFSASWKDALGGRPIRTKVYRTKEGGGAFYLLATFGGPMMGSVLSFTDNTTDDDLGANAKLYTQPGLPGAALSRWTAPSSFAVENYLGMLVVIADDQRTLWSSAARTVGEGLWFNPVWQYPVEGDELLALKEDEGILYVFARRAIFAAVGTPPANGGAGGLDPKFRRISTDVGCTDPRSIVRTSLGLFFRSARGIELLARGGGQVVWIGEKVRKTTDAYPIVTSAVLDEANDVVVFTLAASEADGAVSGTAPRLVFDLSAQAWVSTDEVTSASGAASTPGQSAALVWDEAQSTYAYAWLGADGTVYVEQQASWLDADGSFVPVTWEPAIVKLGLQQQARVWQAVLLYERYDAAGLTAEFGYDFDDYSSTRTFPEADLVGKRRKELRPKSQVSALSLRVKTTAPAAAGTGRGLALVGASFDVAAKQGSTKGTPHLSETDRK